MKWTIPVLGVALALTLTACAPKDTPPTPTPTPVPTPEPTVTATPEPTLQWIDQVYEKVFTADDGATVMTVRYVFPDIVEASSREAWSKISSFYAEEGNAYLTSATENADLALDDYDIAAASGYDFIPYAESFSYEITRQTEELVSIRRTLYAQSATPYPVIYQFCESFDLATGQRLALSDLLAAGWEEPLMTLLQSHDQVAELALDPDALAAGFDPNLFYLTDDALVLYYQEGILGGHALGLVEFSIPYSDLADWLVRNI